MNREEAIESMKASNKLTHAYFDYNEWVTIGKDGYYYFEDGCSCTESAFWGIRKSLNWETGWSIFEPN